MGASSGSDPAIRGQFRSKRATDLAERQFGAISRRQLLALGFTSSRIDWWLSAGRLHGRYPGVYAYGRPSLATEGQLAAGLLLAGAGAALGGISALWWVNLLNRRPAQIHIDAPGGKASHRDVLIRHPRIVHRSWHRDLPIVPLPQALLAAAAHLHHDSLRLVLARAEFHHLLSLPLLQAALGAGVPGTTAVRAAMDAHLPQLALCVNDFERDFVLLCERFRLPLPEPNQRIARFRPDMLWREVGLIVELDGEDAHSTPAQLLADERRQTELERMGFTVLRFTWAEVHSAPEWVAAEVRRHLA